MSEQPQPSGTDVTRAFDELAQLVRSDQPLGQVLGRIAHQTRTLVPRATDVSVTVVDDPSLGQGTVRASSAAFTSDLAVELDERQYERGYGPCLDAAVAGETVLVDVARDHERYPDFTASCERRGITHAVSVGMPVPQRTVGGLNVYTSGEEAFSAAELALVQGFAGFAAVAVTNATLLADSRSEVEHLQTAMRSRAVIEQAKGVVMARQGGSADEAFDALRVISRNTNTKLRLVCEDLVARAGARTLG